MNIGKAIEILTKWREEEYVDDAEELHKAEQLGIEALKLVRQLQAIPGRRESFRLPGETKD